MTGEHAMNSLDLYELSPAEGGRHYHLDRDARLLDKIGGYFTRHMEAMTAENLIYNSDIAAELGIRDCAIRFLKDQASVYMQEAEAHEKILSLFLKLWHEEGDLRKSGTLTHEFLARRNDLLNTTADWLDLEFKFGG